MHIEKVQNNESQFTLILTHDKNCEVIMDEHTSKIVLISKVNDSNITYVDSALTETTPVDKLISLAKSKLGDSYVYAASGPDHFDCSGFVYYLFKENGVTISELDKGFYLDKFRWGYSKIIIK